MERRDDDRGSFEAFYAAHWRDAARWATALTGDAGSGEESAQRAFLAVAARFDRIERPLPYLRRAIVNATRAEHRSRARRTAREERAARRDDAPAALDVELLDVLAELSHPQRCAVVLRYWADWSDDDIAAALGCRPATVRSHLRRGLGRLRTQLGNEETP